MPKISALPVTITPMGDDLVAVVQGGVTKKATLNTLPIPALVTDALALKAPLASPALTGTPTAPTAVTTTSSTQVATTAFVQQELTAGGSTARSLVVSVRNSSGTTMTAGTVVYINGATGNTPTIAKAIATSDTTSAQTIGLVQTGIANNGTGLVVVRGIAGNLDTSALTEGQQLYLSPSTAGAYTITKQFAPNHLVYVGIVTRAHPTLGSIEVVVQNGYEMEELHNVSAQSPTEGNILRWNAATSLWEKYGTFSGTSSGTNTGDQTITLTGDVTGSGTGSFAATVANNAITNAKAAQIATQTFKGRNTAATGNVEDLSVATVKTMLSISNVDNTSDANKPVSTAQQTALNLKADLASPTFTGDPKAPTPLTTDNDTSIATTGMVQNVQQALWTQPTAIAITAAGNSNVAASTAQNRYLTQRINVTAFTGTATVTVQSASALTGDKRRFIVAMPAGLSNLIELRNLTSGGTLLATVPMDGALARTWLGYSTFDGTNWGTVSFSPMSVDEFVLARTAFRGDYIQSDGATSNRAPGGIYGPFDAVNNPREYIAGVASLTLAGIVMVPTSNPSPTAYIYMAAPATSGEPGVAQTRALGVSIYGTGELNFKQVGVGSIGDQRLFGYAGFRAAYSGQTIFLKITFTQGTTNPVVEVNGVNISASFTATTSGTPPAWLDAAMVPTYRLVGYNWPAGPAPIVTPILGATSAADDAFYMSTGKWPAWVVAGGSAVNAITSVSRNSDFSAGATDWTTQFTATASVVSSALNCTTSATFDNIRLAQGFLSRAIVSGLRVRLSCTITNFATTGGTLQAGNATQGSEFYFTITGNGSYSGELTSASTLGYAILFFNQSGAGSFTFTVDNIKLEFLGALSLPSTQPINVIDDVSGIGGNQGRVLGGTCVTDKRSTRILGRINAASATNQQILLGALLPVPLNHAFEFVDVETDGSVTLSLGDGTTATRYTASTALTAGRTRIALSTPFAADSAKTGLYVNVTVAGGTYAQFSILGHLLK